MKPLAFPARTFTARRRLVPLVVAVALILSGCASKAYEGPKLPKSEIAVLHHYVTRGTVLGFAAIVPVPAPKHKTIVFQIDGQTPGLATALARRLHILPGQHSITVIYERLNHVALCGYGGCIANYRTVDLSIKFVAKAGHEYRIPAERSGKRNWIWVEDVTTGKVISGEKPREHP